MSRVLSFNNKPVLYGSKFMTDFQSITSVPNLKYWFAARNQVGISGGTGQQVWQDGSVNGIVTNQPTAGNRAVFTTGVINGLPAWLFNGVNDTQFITTLDILKNKTGYTYHTVFQKTNVVLANQGLIEWYNNSGSTARMGLYLTIAGQLIARVNRATEANILLTAQLNDARWHVASIVANYATNTAYLYLDGNIVATGTIGGTSGANSENVNASGQGPFGFGNGGNLGGYIAEGILYDVAHTHAQVLSIQSTLRRIYGGIP